MTKAELIIKIAKNAGIPDADMKKFFELLLKKISAVVDVGQSLFLKDFGYFHLINGSIKKPIFSFTDNEVSEEQVELVLFSEEKDLKQSDSKGLVFNIPFFDEEDFHPIDSAFSLSIGKPLIPLRGVPFDDIYVPTSGYEYRRLLESKVEKLVSASQIIETEEEFPTLVIDARSYSNQVQLKWDIEKPKVQAENINEDDGFVEDKSELSAYEKQTEELKNIAWDFGEDLSSQIEAESILDITDERYNQVNKSTVEKKIEKNNFTEEVSEPVDNHVIDEIDLEPQIKNEITLEKQPEDLTEQFAVDTDFEDSSAKLDELLNAEPLQKDNVKDIVLDDSISDFNDLTDDKTEEIQLDFEGELIYPDPDKKNEVEEIVIKDEPSDEDFWKSTSKYFETYNPNPKEDEISDIENQNESNIITSTIEQSITSNQLEEETENQIEETGNEVVSEVDTEDIIESNEPIVENKNEELEMAEIETEKSEEQKPEFYEPEKKKNIVPFILFPLLVIVASVALYWYLEYYKKNDTIVKPKQITLKTENANIISRNFDVPVSYPYQPKEKETTIGETTIPKIEEQNVVETKVDETKTEIPKKENKVVEQKPVKDETKQTSTIPKSNTQPKTQNISVPNGKALNVGGNIYKYGDSYVVQVAAFRSKTISDNEAGKYRNKGYAAFVEAAEIPDRGTWYRVRVGNFSSKEEAFRFIEKNIR